MRDAGRTRMKGSKTDKEMQRGYRRLWATGVWQEETSVCWSQQALGNRERQ